MRLRSKYVIWLHTKSETMQMGICYQVGVFTISSLVYLIKKYQGYSVLMNYLKITHAGGEYLLQIFSTNSSLRILARA